MHSLVKKKGFFFRLGSFFQLLDFKVFILMFLICLKLLLSFRQTIS